jgi:hypothetical protein
MITPIQIIVYASALSNIFGVQYFGYDQIKGEKYTAHIEIATKYGKKYEGTYECQKDRKCDIDLAGKFSIELTADEESYSIYIDYIGEEFSPMGCCSFSNWKPNIDFYKTGVKHTFMIYNTTESNLVYIVPNGLARLDIEVNDEK